MDVSNLVTETGDAPVLRGLVDRGCDVAVEVRTFLQDMVESQLADL